MAGTALIAVGGNSLIRAGEKGSVRDQLANARRTAAPIAGLLRDGWRAVVTHGNGPQVGAQLLRSERASGEVYGHSLDVCDAVTQGEIGYFLQQSLDNELAAAGLSVPVVTVLSQVVVAPDDPAMRAPTKPIGPFYTRAEAGERRDRLGWSVVEDAARGWRRVVPSPEPLEIVERDVIAALLERGVLVVAVGGGGIPVVRRDGRLEGIEAVIDKDRASALLARAICADLFVISTDFDRVYLDYKKPEQRGLDALAAAELEAHYRAGHFPPGNMGPKIESVLRFLAGGRGRAIITSFERLGEAVAGRAGTRVTP